MDNLYFTQVDKNIYVTDDINVSGYDYRFRIDGRSGTGYRVDVARPLISLWEAIDDGEEKVTIEEAKSLCEAFVQKQKHYYRKANHEL